MAKIFSEGESAPLQYEPYTRDLSTFDPELLLLYKIITGFQQKFSGVSIDYVNLGPEHAALYTTWFNNEAVRRNLSPSTPRSPEEISTWLELVAKSSTSHYLLITVDGEPAGHAGIKELSLLKHRTAELSLVIGDQRLLGTGIGIAIMLRVFIDACILYNLDSMYIIRNQGTSGANIFRMMGLEHYVIGGQHVYVFQRILSKSDSGELIPFDPNWVTSS